MKTWNIDTVHSEVGFKVKHLMVSTVRGKFDTFEGSISAEDETFNDGKITFSADVASINTHNQGREDHLRSADFFDAEKFPKLTFISTSVKRGEGEDFEVIGDLTIKDVTKSIELKGSVTGVGKGMDGAGVAGFELSGKINRHDFGLSWNALLEAGGAVVSEMVTLDILVEVKEV